jgi:hypothetical protein
MLKHASSVVQTKLRGQELTEWTPCLSELEFDECRNSNTCFMQAHTTPPVLGLLLGPM